MNIHSRFDLAEQGPLGISGNHMLDHFSPGLRGALLEVAEPVALPQGFPLMEAEQMPPYVYFLTAGLASLVVTVGNGGSAEVAMCGKDGMVGVQTLLGPQCGSARTFMQIAGKGLRLRRTAAQQFFAESAEFRESALAWLQASLNVSFQTSACGLLHDAEARLARWLLMCADRSESEFLVLTQEFLAEMLGTQRTTVVLVAGELRRKGLIEHSRGRVTICNRAALEAAACECYRVSREQLAPFRNTLNGARKVNI